MVASAPSTEPKELTPGEVAQRLRVRIETVRRWIKAGVLRGTKSPFNRLVTVPAEELEAFMKRRIAAVQK